MAAYDRLDLDLDPSLLVVPDGASLEDALGFRVEPAEGDLWTAWFDVDDRHRQPLGLVHGGVYAALAETLASVGTVAAVLPGGNLAVGQSNLTHFLRPARAGRITATARPLHRGRTTWIWDVEMHDEEGRLVARSTVTMAVRPREHRRRDEGRRGADG